MGVSQFPRACLTYGTRSRSSLHEEAIASFQQALVPSLGQEDNVGLLFSLAPQRSYPSFGLDSSMAMRSEGAPFVPPTVSGFDPAPATNGTVRNFRGSILGLPN